MIETLYTFFFLQVFLPNVANKEAGIANIN